MLNNISYGRHYISEDDINSVLSTLRSDFLTQGPVLSNFEKAVGEIVSSKYAVAVNSATSALHIAYLSLGLGPGDTLWTSPNTFVATSNAALFCGANVDFVDIDERTYNLCPHKLEEKLILAKDKGSLPKVVVPVHFSGQPCDMEKIHKLSQEYGFKIVEDASHAIGARYKDKPVGNCEFSDITVFSFHPVKIVTTGEGGIATTNSSELSDKMKLISNHYITRDEAQMVSSPDGPWTYEQLGLGYNFRLPDILASLGLSQLKSLEKFIQKRNEVAAFYNESLNQTPLNLPYQIEESASSFHLYVVTNEDRLKLFHFLRERKITPGVHYIPVHLQPFYKKKGFKKGDFPVSESFYNSCLSLPIYYGLSEEEMKYVSRNIIEFFK
ncbi:MAG: UDP-4-amino-4,6-dideoxy-N-acetyl-beta-L-altrosamine transaminase [Bacteriovoracaceae bacterium]|nr:UDP-4-amino-4,6-dideoxy-N-acetyl-beta-L-altrosamine transaminase [Bacteriovoracaceae bacterium]